MIITRLVDFTTDKFRGVTVLDAEGNYNIYLNAHLSDEMKQEAYEHEIRHIVNGDLDCIGSIQLIERITHN